MSARNVFIAGAELGGWAFMANAIMVGCDKGMPKRAHGCVSYVGQYCHACSCGAFMRLQLPVACSNKACALGCERVSRCLSVSSIRHVGRMPGDVHAAKAIAGHA